MDSMRELSDEQEIRLKRLTTELEGLTTPEVILEALRLQALTTIQATATGNDDYSDAAVEQARQTITLGLSGAIAAEKVLSYLTALRDFNLMRQSLGQLIHEHVTRPKPTTEAEAEEYAKSFLIAGKNAGLQEVTIHYFCSCTIHLYHLLKKAAEAAGYEIPEVDLETLNHYRELRNYFEHIHNRLPGSVNDREMVQEFLFSKGEMRWKIGLESDDQNQVVMNGKAFDVTTQGLEAIEDAVIRTWEELKPAAIAGVRNFYRVNATNIPDPEKLNHDLLVKLNGDRKEGKQPY